MPLKMPPVLTNYFSFNGGLDQVTPPIQLYNGALRFGTNVEIGVRGGYTRCAGYERFSGKARPSDAEYAILNVSLTGTVNVGDVVTNLAATVFGTVIAVAADYLVLTKITGVFSTGNIYVSAVLVGTCTGAQMVSGASTPALDASYRALAANVYRAMIDAVPGAGPIRGVHQYNGKVYAFRNNISNTQCVMHESSAAGWVPVALGREMLFKARTSTVTITIASPGVITWNAHGLVAGQKVVLTTTGALPTGFTAGVQYFVVSPAANTFQLAATAGGTAINTTGTQSGTHTAQLVATEIVDGDTVTGATSGATAIARRVLLRTGTWGTLPVGSLVFTSVTGAFVNGEGISVGGQLTVNADSADTAITLLPNGRYEFQNWNFGGQTGTLRMYGCDGVNRGFEFDGTVYVPIRTGMTTDAPKFLQIHKNILFFAFGPSLQYSGIAAPYTFNPLFGAGEIACGDTISNLKSMPGSENGGAMMITTTDRNFVLYGNDSDDFNLVPFSYEAGAVPYTLQIVIGALALDTNGITTLGTTQRYGNFLSALISDKITPFLVDKLTSAVASCTVRKKNQYRLFFASGEAVVVSYMGEKLLGMTPLQYAHDVTCISSLEGASGQEEIYFGSSDGYVRQAEIGTSFDGEPIFWNATLVFNHFSGPRQLKTFRRAAFEVSGQGYAEFSFSTSLGYGSSEFAASAESLSSADMMGSNWDSFIWDQFFWDGRSLLPSEVDIVGTAENISLLFSGNSDAFLPFTLHSAIMHYTPRRLLR